VFRWTGVVRRPLTLNELREALAVRPGDDSFRRDRLVNGFEHIEPWCGHLITLDEESSAVQFAHASLKRFLASGAAAAPFGCAPVDDDTHVGETCVTYLCLSDFERQLVKKQHFDVAVDPAGAAVAALAASGSSLFAKPLKKFATMHKGACAAETINLAPLLQTAASDPMQSAQQFAFIRYAAEHWIPTPPALLSLQRHGSIFIGLHSTRDILPDRRPTTVQQ
jgi:hypothetical protein